MAIQRLQLLYPYCTFRAKIDYKNIEQGKTWAVGQLYGNGKDFFIIDISGGEKNYTLTYIIKDTLSLKTPFITSFGRDIFECDRLKIVSEDGTTDIEDYVYFTSNNPCITNHWLAEFFDEECKPREGFTIKITGNAFDIEE